MFKLLNKEFSFDVDVSRLPCGLNGALYFVQMDHDGGMSRFPSNKAGAKYGTGYCDAQVRRHLEIRPLRTRHLFAARCDARCAMRDARCAMRAA